MSSRSSVTLQLSTGLAVLIVVACSPSKDRVQIIQEPATKAQLAINSCRDSLRNSLAVDVSKLKKSVSVCRETPASSLHLAEQPVAYRISKSNAADEATVISLKIGLRTAKDLSEKAQRAFVQIFNEQCLNQTEAIYARSKLSGTAPFRLETRASFESAGGATSEAREFTDNSTTADQNLSLTQYQEAGEEFFTIAGSISHARFYVNGRKASFSACEAAYKTNRLADETRSLCQAAHAARRKANAPFCMEVAQLIGAWTGVTSPVIEANKCDVNKPEPKSKPVAQDAASASFSNANVSMAESFFTNAKLNESELIQILSPACPGLEAELKDSAK